MGRTSKNPPPIVLARIFCSTKVTLADVVARARAYYDTLAVEIDVVGEVATFSQPGLRIRVERFAKLSGLLAEAKALGWESAQARAKRRGCAFRVEIEISPSYEGAMLTTGHEDIPDVPDVAVGFVEFLSVTPGADYDVFDAITRSWSSDPR